VNFEKKNSLNNEQQFKKENKELKYVFKTNTGFWYWVNFSSVFWDIRVKLF